MGEVDIGWVEGSGAGGDDDMVSVEASFVVDLECVGIDEFCEAVKDGDVVAVVKGLPHAFLFGDDRFGAGSQLGEGWVEVDSHIFEDGVVHRFHDAVDGEAEGFAGDGSPVGAATTDACVGFDDGDGAIGFGQLHGGAFATGAGADDQDIESAFGGVIVEVWHGVRFGYKKSRRNDRRRGGTGCTRCPKGVVTDQAWSASLLDVLLGLGVDVLTFGLLSQLDGDPSNKLLVVVGEATEGNGGVVAIVFEESNLVREDRDESSLGGVVTGIIDPLPHHAEVIEPIGRIVVLLITCARLFLGGWERFIAFGGRFWRIGLGGFWRIEPIELFFFFFGVGLVWGSVIIRTRLDAGIGIVGGLVVGAEIEAFIGSVSIIASPVIASPIGRRIVRWHIFGRGAIEVKVAIVCGSGVGCRWRGVVKRIATGWWIVARGHLVGWEAVVAWDGGGRLVGIGIEI